MAKKKKSNNKKSKVNKSSNKSSKKISKVNSSKSSKKPSKSPKKSSKTLKTSKGKQLKKAFSKILSKETWREKPGRAPRRKSLKLTTQGDKNRYQQIVKAISDYYKGVGKPVISVQCNRTVKINPYKPLSKTKSYHAKGIVMNWIGLQSFLFGVLGKELLLVCD